MSFLHRRRTTLRLALGDLKASKLRSALIVALVALPVGGMLGLTVGQDSTYSSFETASYGDRTLANADLVLDYTGPSPIDQTGAQSWTLKSASEGTTPLAGTLDQALPQVNAYASIPTGDVITRGEGQSVSLKLYALDLTNPLNANVYRLVRGTLPSQPYETALSRGAAEQMQVSVGDKLTLTGVSHPVAVTAIVEDPRQVKTAWFGLFTAYPAPLQPQAINYRATLRAPLSAAELATVNQAGYKYVERAQLQQEVANESQDIQSGELVQHAAVGAGDVAIGGVGALGLVLVAVLASAGFAIGAKSRRRQHALLLASGATQANVRNAALLQGVVLGIIGSIVGVVVSLSVVYALRGPISYAEDVRIDHLKIDWHGPVVFGALGVVACVLGALLPAVSAGRTSVADAMADRPTAPRNRRWPLWLLIPGTVLVVLAIVILIQGAHGNDYNGVGIGTGVLVLASIFFVPSLLVLAGSIKRGPTALRIALRDARRNLGRSTATVAAVSLGAVVVMVVSAISSVDQANDRDNYLPPAFTNQVFFSLDNVGKTSSEMDALVAERMAQIGTILPNALTSVRSNIVSSGCASNGAECTSSLTVLHAATSPCADPESAVQDVYGDRSTKLAACMNRASQNTILNGDEAALRTMSPDHQADAGALQALGQGKAVVFDTTLVNANGAIEIVDSATQKRTTLPAYVLPKTLDGMPGALISPATAKSLGFNVQNPIQIVFTATSVPTDQQLNAIRAIAATQQINFVYHYSGYDHTTALSERALPLTAAVFALVATLAVLGLSLGEQQSTLSTMGSVGATPGYRRLLAATNSFVVALLGTLWGVIVGAVAGAAFIWTGRWQPTETVDVHKSVHWFHTFPWFATVVLIIAVPLSSALAALLFTRSQLIVRRQAS